MISSPRVDSARKAVFGACVGSICFVFAPCLHAIDDARSVSKAICGPNDRVETVQGQTTLAERFRPGPAQAYNCNLELVGQFEGEGASADVEIYNDCVYFSTASLKPNPDMRHPGVVVLDVSNSSQPKATTYLSSPAMLGAQESLEVDTTRKLLIASTLPDIFDVYDLSSDCKNPTLINSQSVPGLVAHDGEFAPDGLTFYGGKWPSNPQDPPLSAVFALDVSDPKNLRSLASWLPSPDWPTHGAAVNADGTRVYVAIKRMSPDHQKSPNPNGLIVLDANEIQSRKPQAQFHFVSQLFWEDSLGAEGMQFIKIHNRPYLVFSDNLGAIGYKSPPPPNACDSGKPGHGFARIIDLTDEKNPKTISRLMPEVADPRRCREVMHDPTLYGGYGSFACTVDDPADGRLMACGNFEAGLRIFDIRDPFDPQEVAYYKPPARRTENRPGSIFRLASAGPQTSPARNHTADSVVVAPRFQKNGQEIWFISVDNGFQVVRFSDRFRAAHRDLFDR